MNLTFERILQMAEVKYIIKKEMYGESWKKMDIDTLRKRLIEESNEWKESYVRGAHPDKEFDELIDIINVACMIAERIRPEQKGAKK